MDYMVFWQVGLSVIGILLGWVWNQQAKKIEALEEELHRVTVLLNRTREEIAKEYVTKAEVHADINRVINRLEALDAKLDRILESRAR